MGKLYYCNRCGRIAHIVFAKGLHEDLCELCYEYDRDMEAIDLEIKAVELQLPGSRLNPILPS